MGMPYLKKSLIEEKIFMGRKALQNSVRSVCTMVDFMHKISFELANQHSLHIQNSMGVQAPSAQIKGLWLGASCMRPEEHKLEIFFGPVITDDWIGKFLSAVLWFAL